MLNGANFQLVNVRLLSNCEIKPFHFIPADPAPHAQPKPLLGFFFVVADPFPPAQLRDARSAAAISAALLPQNPTKNISVTAGGDGVRFLGVLSMASCCHTLFTILKHFNPFFMCISCYLFMSISYYLVIQPFKFYQTNKSWFSHLPQPQAASAILCFDENPIFQQTQRPSLPQ